MKLEFKSFDGTSAQEHFESIFQVWLDAYSVRSPSIAPEEVMKWVDSWKKNHIQKDGFLIVGAFDGDK
ncbi:MAG: hypothetical protein AB7O96_02190 [Pseudobdellovibrionaceae bacterium]